MIPSCARTVIVGGGVVGSSVAYHLSKVYSNVVLLEQEKFTSGSTWHAAGILGQIRNSMVESKMTLYSKNLYQEIEKENPVGFKQCGAINLASSKERHIYYEKLSAKLKDIGVSLDPISNNDVKKLEPNVCTDNTYSSWWYPNESVINPSDITIELCRRAKKNGVKMFEDTRVNSIEPKSKSNVVINTNNGTIEAENIVFCTGMWTRQFFKSLNTLIPIQPCHHFYAITEPCGINPLMPVIRDSDNHIYIKEWSGGVCFGGFEPNAKVCFEKSVPSSIPFHLFDDDWDQFEPLFNQSLKKFPKLNTLPIRKLYNGPESFTTDMSCVIDRLDKHPNIYVAAGCNSSGIAMSGGIGKTVTELITQNETEWDISNLSLKRFKNHELTDKYLINNIANSIGNHYKSSVAE